LVYFEEFAAGNFFEGFFETISMFLLENFVDYFAVIVFVLCSESLKSNLLENRCEKVSLRLLEKKTKLNYSKEFSATAENYNETIAANY